jgi:NAD(P)-dependent dehydrogenase (short-subunit alcohol dehydrogenase family)
MHLIGARDRQRNQAAAEGLGGTFVEIDPSDEHSVDPAAARVREEHGRLDVLNNVGTAAPRLGARVSR